MPKYNIEQIHASAAKHFIASKDLLKKTSSNPLNSTSSYLSKHKSSLSSSIKPSNLSSSKSISYKYDNKPISILKKSSTYSKNLLASSNSTDSLNGSANQHSKYSHDINTFTHSNTSSTNNRSLSLSSKLKSKRENLHEPIYDSKASLNSNQTNSTLIKSSLSSRNSLNTLNSTYADNFLQRTSSATTTSKTSRTKVGKIWIFCLIRDEIFLFLTKS